MDTGEQGDAKVERAAIWSDAENELLVETVTSNERLYIGPFVGTTITKQKRESAWDALAQAISW